MVGADDDHAGIAFMDASADGFDRGVTVGSGHLVKLVDQHQCRRGEAQRRQTRGVDGVEVHGGIDDVDDPAEVEPVVAHAGDHPCQGQGFGESAGFDDDRVETELGIRHRHKRVLELGIIGQAAHASARDRQRFVDLADDEPGVDVEVTEVVDDDADAGFGVAQKVIEQARFSGTEVAGEQDDRDRRSAGGAARAPPRWSPLFCSWRDSGFRACAGPVLGTESIVEVWVNRPW